MKLTLKPEHEQRIQQLVEGGDYSSPEAVVQEALDWYLGLEEEALPEAQAAIAEALDQSRRGETISREEFEDRMRLKHGLRC